MWSETQLETTTRCSKIKIFLWCTVRKRRHLQTLTNWQWPPWQILAVVTMVATAGHRPVSPTRGEPARMPQGRPAVEQVSANKQSARAEEQERKKTAALAITPHPSIIPQTPTQNCEMQPSLSSPSLSIFLSIFLLSSLLVPPLSELQSLACSSQRVLVQNELMFTINKSAEGKPQSSCSQDRVEYKTCHPTQHWASFWSHYS